MTSPKQEILSSSSKIESTPVKCGFVTLGLAGSGGYADVYIIEDKGIKKALRVPKENKEDYESEGINATLELDIMSRIRHPNLMYAEILFEEKSCIGIPMILPYAPKTLTTVILEKKITVSERINIGFQILCAANWLLFNNIIHLDIKLNNILFYTSEEKEEIPLLSDFGMAVKMEDPNISVTVDRKVIIPAFKPYEMLNGDNKIGEYTLVWQLGMLLLGLFFEISLVKMSAEEILGFIEKYFSNAIDVERRKRSLYTLSLKWSTFEDRINDSCIDLLNGMLDLNITSRLNMKQVLTHSFWKYSSNTGVQPKIILGSVVMSKYSKPLSCVDSINRLFKFNKDTVKNDHIPAGLFFTAVDLIYRSIYLIDSTSDRDLLIHNIACNILSWKLYSFRILLDMSIYESYFVIYNIRRSEIFDMEKKIILALGGILYRPNLFDTMTNKELTISLKILFDADQYTAYNKTEIIRGNKLSMKTIYEYLILNR
jgi:serine/threonine protein kinase